MPFDRLVQAVDDWAGSTGRNDVFAQIGTTSLRPRRIKWTAFLDPADFKRVATQASVILAHAGTGSILTAMEYQKPILVMPRRAELHETRNDHQVATAVRFRIVAGVSVAMDEHELRERLNELQGIERPQAIGRYASDQLISGVRVFLDGITQPSGRPQPQRAAGKISHGASSTPVS